MWLNLILQQKRKNNTHGVTEEEEPVVGSKRKVGNNLSQPDKKFKRKASRPKMVHNLTTDNIDMIVVPVGVSTEEALMMFQNRQKENLENMVKQLVALQDSITQLHTDPSTIVSQQEQQSKRTADPTI